MFLQCIRGDDDRLKFRLLREYRIAYGEQCMLENVRAIMEIIKWFLAEAVKAPRVLSQNPRKRQKLDVKLVWLWARDVTRVRGPLSDIHIKGQKSQELSAKLQCIKNHHHQIVPLYIVQMYRYLHVIEGNYRPCYLATKIKVPIVG